MSTRILQVCLSPNLGGLELYMQRLSLFLHSHVETYICVSRQGRLNNSFTDQSTLPKLELHKHGWKNLYKNAKTLAQYIDTHEIAIVHMHWTKDLPLCVFAKYLSKRKPFIVQSRHMNMTRFKSDFYHRYLYKNIDLMIAVTEQVKQQIVRFVPAEICPPIEVSYIGAPIYQSLEPQKLSALRQQYKLENSFVITLAGRIEPAKGQALLIDALKCLNDSDVKVMFIGDAMEEEYLRSLKQNISNQGLTSQVIFTGFVNNVQDLMAASDCVVLATEKETFGMVLIEAMHTGTAVIASNSGGPIEIIDSNKTGLLFKNNEIQDLVLQLTSYIQERSMRERLADAGKTKALSMFESEKQFKEVLELLKQTPSIAR